ncbi:hypothetical protein BO99DRAFT_428440 [Aspergillus violaceofuscus CBS 115571]|uniref:Condensation domain-containing protein n=1 Tax=Aspergillus violaceofuscus (strain CBS 115571) TaxID=1450538 RepID=A0A2V5HKB1_ASPV1|nr:hypothetical protein BO99DRAFT_428440 [Aspergillus violaceofuscus CBS 115571]
MASTTSARYTLPCHDVAASIKGEAVTRPDATTKSPWEWQEIAPGRFTRELDDGERMFHNMALTGRRCVEMHVNIEISTQVSTEDFIHRARRSWRHMRLVHPHITSIFRGERFIFQALEDTEIESWLQETFRVVKGTFDDDEILNLTQSCGRPMIYYFRDLAMIHVCFPHVFGDGTSLFAVTQAFLQELSALASGSSNEGSLAYEALKDRKPAPAGWAAMQLPVLTREARNTISRYKLQQAPPAGSVLQRPILDHNNLPPLLSLKRFALSSLRTARANAAAASHGASLYHGVHAALIHAAAQLAERGPLFSYRGAVVTNTRRIPAGKSAIDREDLGSWIGFWMLTMDVDEADYWATVKALADAYATCNEHQEAMLPFMVPSFTAMADSIAPYLFNPFILSPVGNITRYMGQRYSDFDIKDMWCTVLPQAEGIMTHFYLHNSEAHLTMSYDTRCVESAWVERFAELVERRLLETVVGEAPSQERQQTVGREDIRLCPDRRGFLLAEELSALGVIELAHHMDGRELPFPHLEHYFDWIKKQHEALCSHGSAHFSRIGYWLACDSDARLSHIRRLGKKLQLTELSAAGELILRTILNLIDYFTGKKEASFEPCVADGGAWERLGNQIQSRWDLTPLLTRLGQSSPNLSILEIGAGTVTMISTVLDALGSADGVPQPSV